MTDLLTWLTNVLEPLHDRPVLLLLVIGLLAFWEGLVIAGLFTTSLLLLSVTAGAISGGALEAVPVAIAAAIGALCGDHLSYFLGRGLSAPLTSRLPARAKRRLLRSHQLIERYGSGAILVGRLVPPIRSVVPFTAGVGQLSPRRFMVADLVSCAVWASALGFIAVGIARL